MPIYAIIILAFMKPFERMNHDVMQANSMVSSAIIEDINGIETIKSLTSEEVRYQILTVNLWIIWIKVLRLVSMKLCKRR